MTWQRASGTREAPAEPLWELILDLGRTADPALGPSLSGSSHSTWAARRTPPWESLGPGGEGELAFLAPLPTDAAGAPAEFCVKTVSIVCVTRAPSLTRLTDADRFPAVDRYLCQFPTALAAEANIPRGCARFLAVLEASQPRANPRTS